MPCDNYYTAYHQGQVAAYNMLALDIPNAVVPFTYTKQYNTYFNYSGYAAYYNEMHIEGDLKNMDFIVYYSLLGTVKIIQIFHLNPFFPRFLLLLDQKRERRRCWFSMKLSDWILCPLWKISREVLLPSLLLKRTLE